VSWDQLLDIILTNERVQAERAARRLVDCPRCGKPLTTGPTGQPHCTFDGYGYDGPEQGTPQGQPG
jgi:hypothetical protein